MTTISLTRTSLRVHPTRSEKILGLLRDTEVPLSAVRAVEVVPDGIAAARGIRAPGLGIPGVRLVGTWRGRSRRALVSVRRQRPAVHVRLEGDRWSELLLDVDEPASVAERIRSALG
ncbi:hypothetical protein N866_10675 [Actinotalea ferrariae CF5-4]|uniref:Bacterial Pleckstrin homology domain-containing protein n=1 Tax=Actinotalea ferrariae CF5-4 TaxID=948458 RepID=A0A021VLX2_9CELL|nr:hypothetical protein [Actinotalea ferrariae]EYR62214.1 hypothetical protein N866_10675 [Actinotalea ferrariae CF5-4]